MAPSFTPLHRGGSGPPLLLLHGITDTWRTWQLVLDELQHHFEVLAPTLLGHAGGPALEGGFSEGLIPDAVERAMDEAGWETAHIVGNSLGGFTALTLAARGRAESVVALAPAMGWAADSGFEVQAAEFFRTMHGLVKQAAPHAEAIVATEEGRRRATEFATVKWEHIPAELLAHQIAGSAESELLAILDYGLENPPELDAAAINCPVRIAWGTEDKILPWPQAAARYREEWMPNADWVVLDGVGHCPQLDVPEETGRLIREFAGA